MVSAVACVVNSVLVVILRKEPVERSIILSKGEEDFVANFMVNNIQIYMNKFDFLDWCLILNHVEVKLIIDIYPQSKHSSHYFSSM